MKYNFVLILFCLISLNIPLHSQDKKKVDSLTVITNSPIDSVKANAFNALGVLYIKKQKPNEARDYALKAIAISQKSDFKKGVADAYNLIGGWHLSFGRFDSALIYNKLTIDYYTKVKAYKKIASLYQNRSNILRGAGRLTEAIETIMSALSYNKRLKDTAQMGDNYLSLGDLAYNLGKFDESIKNHIQAQKFYEAVHNVWGGVMSTNNIASVYRFQKQPKRAIENYTKVYELSKSIGRMDGIIAALDNIGATYIEMGDYPNGEKNLLESYDLLKKNPEETGKALICVHLAVLYHSQNDLKKAEPYYLESMKLYEEANDIHGVSAVYSNLGILYKEQGKLKQSIEILLRSIAISKKLGTKLDLKSGYNNLALSYFKTHNFEKAYEYLNLCSLVKDSLYTDKTNEVIGEMEAKYENDKKKKELALKNSELSKKELEVREQNLQKLAFAGGAGALLILGLVLYRGNAVKKKANHLLIVQKQEISQQKGIIEERNKDITDSIKYAKHIQEAILPSKQLVNELIPDNFILYEPKDIVSGDFYWIEEHEGLVLFAVADCTGHGVPGALISVVCSNALGKAVNENKLTKPSDILDYISNAINNTLRQKQSESSIRDGMDIALCSYDPKERTLDFAGANNPLYIVRNGEMSVIKGDKQPIGSYIDDQVKPFTNHTIKLEKNDLVLLFSDGFADQFGGPAGKKLKYSQLQKLFLKFNQLFMHEIKESLHTEFISWKGNLEQVDDVCIMGVRIS